MKTPILLTVVLFTAVITSAHMVEAKGTLPAAAATVADRDDSHLQILILAKHFCVALRRYHEPDKADALREFIDPEYLKTHAIAAEAFLVETLPFTSIHNIQVADDGHTALCLVSNQAGDREVLLLQTVIRDGKMFIRPLSAPDSHTGRFHPWTLRMTVIAAKA